MLKFTLEDVKTATGLTGEYQNGTVEIWLNEVIDFLRDAGVAESNITCGIAARGVLDLWDYDSGQGKLSQYFMRRASQLSFKK